MPRSELDGVPYSCSGALPLVIEPGSANRSLEELESWLRAEAPRVRAWLTEHGAIRFRGFDVKGPEDFERLARAIDDDLKNEYLGTSPRDSVTDYVFNASELPEFFPIAQHCEMSFCANPPNRVFFCCLTEPAAGSGETPLCDFRAVWKALDPALRDRFVERGIQIVRNYTGPGGGRDDDPTMLKPWHEMFLTTNRAEVERQCKDEGFEVEWLDDDSLRLWSSQPVYRDHPASGERVWHNHLTTFHSSMAEGEYRRIAAMRPSERHAGLHAMASALDAKLSAQPSEERSMHCRHLDGEEIAAEDVEAVRDAVWENTVFQEWKLGDVVAIDNHSTSHGRMPYEGPRRVVVCWS